MNLLTLTLGPLGTNCYLVWGEEGGEALLVDCAGEPETILAEMEARGLRLRLIVATHGHIDHIGALADVARRTAAQVAVHELDAGQLTEPMLSGAALFGLPQEPVAPDLVLREGDMVGLESAGISFRVLHTPGHTPGSICLLGDGILLAGDTLFAGGIGRTDLPGGDEGQMMESLSRLMDLPDTLVVYPGHGPTTTIGEERQHNPWVKGW